jgi:4a-hydroxytetrahydrobiopterin dehydratase
MKLTPRQIQQRLEQMFWQVEQGRLTRSFSFDSYGAGVAFAVQVALLSEKLNHHPDSLDIGWKKVTVAYITHDVDGLTQNDFLSAEKVDALFFASP